ncbi:hypothetical protein GQ457_18G007150 [Hibiscus cannabinus]
MFNGNHKSLHIKLLITIWAIWNSRNRLLYEGFIQRVEKVVTFIKGYCQELEVLSHSFNHPSRHDSDKWCAPPPLHYKINVDASVRLVDSKSSLGFLARDSESNIMGAGFYINNNLSLVFSAEAEVIFQGLEFAKDLGLHRVVVEGDNKSMVEKLISHSQDILDIGSIIQDVKILASSFASCACRFIGWSGNQSAQALASEGLKSSSNLFWVDAPPLVKSLAARDRRLLEPP